MKTRTQIFFTLLFATYLSIILWTDFSITGFWPDVVLSILLSIVGIIVVLIGKSDNVWHTISIKTTNIICLFVVFGYFGLQIINPFALDTLKLRGFFFQKINGRLFNAYFKPVGSYSGGYGNFWITETPKCFPVIEWQVYWERTVHHDFSSDTFEGETIDNKSVVRSYIKEYIIDKNK